jgi:hypothetical protein
VDASLDLQRAEVLGTDLLAGRIATTIEPRGYDEAATVGRVADQVGCGSFMSALEEADPITYTSLRLGRTRGACSGFGTSPSA